MFKKLRNKIIIITMAITTTVLLIAGGSIMFFSSTIRPEPVQPSGQALFDANFNDQELRVYIRNDRKEGSARLLTTLLSVGVAVEVIVFVIVYYLSEKIVAPVQDAYDKQKMFIANASHELKTPLAIIEANMEALDVDKENEKWKDNIEDEIDHANKLVLDLLQLAKMDAGDANKSEPQEVNLGAEIKKRVEMFKPKFSGDISFKIDREANRLALPKQDILQILDILLDNATKYGDKKVSVVLEENGITIANDGATIPGKDLEKVFDRFYQTDKTREGSGLGLAIAKNLCEQNNWQIVCESKKGTTKFSVRF